MIALLILLASLTAWAEQPPQGVPTRQDLETLNQKILGILPPGTAAQPNAFANAQKATEQAQGLEMRMSQLEKDIRGMIHLDCREVAQCHTVGFGVKPCGGPRRYLIYSTMKTDEKALQAQVEKYNSMDTQRNQLLHVMSTCMVTPQPTVACLSWICTTGLPQPGDPHPQ